MNIEILANELAQYAGMDDQAVAAALNERGAATARLVPVTELLNGAYQTGLYARLLAASRAELPGEVYGELTALLHLVNSPIREIDLHSAAAGRMIATLTGAKLVSAEEVAMLRALAVVPGRSRAEALGLGAVAAEDVAAAREWLAARDAAEARRREFDALRERLVGGYHAALAWLQSEERAGKKIPEWDDVIGKM